MVFQASDKRVRDRPNIALSLVTERELLAGLWMGCLENEFVLLLFESREKASLSEYSIFREVRSHKFERGALRSLSDRHCTLGIESVSDNGKEVLEYAFDASSSLILKTRDRHQYMFCLYVKE